MTAIRVIVGPKLSNSAPMAVELEDVMQVVFGIRDIDVGYITYSDTGSIIFDIDLPEAITSIDAISPRVLNSEYDAVDLTCYANIADIWTDVSPDTQEVLSGVTNIRVKMDMDLVGKSKTPIVSGFDIEYSTIAPV